MLPSVCSICVCTKISNKKSGIVLPNSKKYIFSRLPRVEWMNAGNQCDTSHPSSGDPRHYAIRHRYNMFHILCTYKQKVTNWSRILRLGTIRQCEGMKKWLWWGVLDTERRILGWKTAWTEMARLETKRSRNRIHSFRRFWTQIRAISQNFTLLIPEILRKWRIFTAGCIFVNTHLAFCKSRNISRFWIFALDYTVKSTDQRQNVKAMWCLWQEPMLWIRIQTWSDPRLLFKKLVDPHPGLVGPETSFLKVGGSGSILSQTWEFFSGSCWIRIWNNHCRPGYNFFELRMSLIYSKWPHF